MRTRSLLLLTLLGALLGPLACAPADAEVEEAAADPASEEEVLEAQEEFSSIDLNKDGTITRDEISNMEEPPEQEEIDEFFETYDENGDGLS